MSASAAMLFFAMAAVGYTVTGLVGFGANLLMMPILSMFFSARAVGLDLFLDLFCQCNLSCL